MPTILRERGFRFFFYMADRFEPPHVHVQRDDCAAKLWLDPLEFAFIEGFRRHELQHYHGASGRVPSGMVSDFWRFAAMSDLRIQRLSFSGELVTFAFSEDRSVVVPLHYFPRLQGARPEQREQWQLIGRGLGVHWEALDEDLSVENILSAYSRSKAGEYAHASPS